MMAIGVCFVILSAAGCRSSSDRKSGGNPPVTLPVIPIVTPPSQELTAEECKVQLLQLLNHQEPAKIAVLPSSLRNIAFLIALSVNSGKIDAKCLDFTYAND